MKRLKILTIALFFAVLVAMVAGCVEPGSTPTPTPTHAPQASEPDPQFISWPDLREVKYVYYKGALTGVNVERAIINRGSPGDVTVVLSIKPAGRTPELWSKVFFMNANIPYKLSAFVPTTEQTGYTVNVSVRPSLPSDKDEGEIAVRKLIPPPELEELALGTAIDRDGISYALMSWELADALERSYEGDTGPEGGRYRYLHCEPEEGHQYLLARMRIVNNRAEVWPERLVINPEASYDPYEFHLILDKSEYAEQAEYAYRHMITAKMWHKRPWVRLQPGEEWEDNLVFEIPEGSSLDEALLLADFGGKEGWTWWRLSR